MSAFRVGQEVICIKAGLWRNRATREIMPDQCGPAFKEVCVVTWVGSVEGVAVIKAAGYDPILAARRFRPASYPKRDQSHDVALIKSLLAPERRSASRPVSASAASTEPTAKLALSAFSGEGA